jgi:5-methylcytosine-specific restriction endonuclease McrA
MANAPKYRRLKSSVDRTHVRERAAPDPRYNTALWRATAAAVRVRDEFLCQMCLKEDGLAEAMAEMRSRRRNKDGSMRESPVDHIIPAHRCDDEMFFDEKNCQNLCVRHNKLKSQRDAKRYGVARR